MLKDMHSTLVEAGGSAYTLTLKGGNPGMNLGKWVEDEFKEELANGQVSMKKRQGYIRYDGFSRVK